MKTNKRQEWIQQRTAELLANGWRNPQLAARRAAKEWRVQSPQHQAARRRSAAMVAARNERHASLPTSDPLAM